MQQKKYREQKQAFLIEGVRLCEEALQAGADLEQMLYCPEQTESDRSRALLQTCSQRAIPLTCVDADVVADLSDTQAPQGIVGVVRKKNPIPFAPNANKDALVLAIDRLADPGNLGTILRTAAWFGVKTILLGHDTVELYNPKVVRSSMGSLFRLDIYEDLDLNHIAGNAKTAGWRLLAAEVVNVRSSHHVSGSGRDLLFLGSEAHGLTTTLDQHVDIRITIPGCGAAESLNAAIATGILLYQLTLPSHS